MRQCPQCGFSELQLAGSSHLGCARCYTVFEHHLETLLWNYQRATVHQGESPQWQGGQAESQVYREAIDKARNEGRDDDAEILSDLLRFLEDQ